MTHEKLISHLAAECSRRIKAEKPQTKKQRRALIAKVCGYSPSLMKEVGSAMGTWNAIKQAIKRVKQKEEAEKNTLAKQLTLF